MISKEQVIHIANLARLDLTEQEIEKMQKDLAGILDYIGQLNKVDISGIDPNRNKVSNGVNLSKTEFVLENVLRKDNANPESEEVKESMLNQAPEREGSHIKVKEILT